MTLAELGSLGEVVGAIGAVAALAYLALQIRQNTEGLRINSYHQATAELARLLEAIYLDREFSEIFRRGSADPTVLSDQERARFTAYLASFFYAYENLYDLPAELAMEVQKTARLVALAMKEVTACEGVLLLQRNEPAAGQRAWHYHLHVIPRFQDDQLLNAERERFPAGERAKYAKKLKAAIKAER